MNEVPQRPQALDDEFELRKIKLLDEVKTDVSAWGRFWLGTFVAVISLAYFALGIFGYLGFFQIVEGRLKLAIEDEVKKPAKDIHDKLDNLAQSAQDQLNRTIVNTGLADKLLQNSEARLKELDTKNRQLQLQVDEWLGEVKKFQKEFESIRSSWKTLSTKVKNEINAVKAARKYLYGQTVGLNLDVVDLEYRLRHLDERLQFIREMSSEVSDADNVKAVARPFQMFEQRWSDAKEQFAEVQRILKERKNAKVIYYTLKHNRRRADRVVAELRKKGFLAESWVTRSTTVNGAASEIAKEFELSLGEIFWDGARTQRVVIGTERTVRLLKHSSLAAWRQKEGLDDIQESKNITPTKNDHLVPRDRITKNDLALIVDLAEVPANRPSN